MITYSDNVQTDPDMGTFPAAVKTATRLAKDAVQVAISPDIAIVWHCRRNEWVFYNCKAWEKPDETPLLPWSPPEYPPFATVTPEGVVTLARDVREAP